jgi:hypothetical protein
LHSDSEEPHRDVALSKGSGNHRPFQAGQPHCNGLPDFAPLHYNCCLPVSYPTHSHLRYPFMYPLPPALRMSTSSYYLCQVSVNFNNLLSMTKLEFSPCGGICLHLLKGMSGDHQNQGHFAYDVLLCIIPTTSGFPAKCKVAGTC